MVLVKINPSPEVHRRLKKIKKRHGMTWLGMLIIAERALLNAESGVKAEVPVIGTLLKGVEASVTVTAPAPTKQGDDPGEF